MLGLSSAANTCALFRGRARVLPLYRITVSFNLIIIIIEERVVSVPSNRLDKQVRGKYVIRC